ncbi:MAG: PilZ domain-containing protein [Candidatus Acidiferrales bacterium]
MKTETLRVPTAKSSIPPAKTTTTPARAAAQPGKRQASSAGAAGSSQALAGEERRRSQRVLLRVRANIHVALQGKPTTFDTTTLSVNSHGAMIVLKQSLPPDTRLVLEHSGTKERVACKVIRAARENSEGFQIPIEFDSPAPNFWGIAFPPNDWRPDDL